MSESSFSELYSHPGKALEEHLVNVAHIAVKNLEQCPADIFKQIDKKLLSRLIRTSALCHDLGKATSFFQNYLFALEEEKEKLKTRQETHHGLLSAVATFFAVKAELEKEKHLTGDDRAFLSFIAFLTVRKHHGDLEDVMDEATCSEKDKAILLTQIESIDERKLSILNARLKEAGLIQDIHKELLKGWVLSLPDELRVIKRNLRKLERQKSIDPYLLTNFLFSLLIDADKSEVSTGKIVERNTAELDYYMVDKYKTTMNIEDTYLNKLREKAYREVLEKHLDLDSRLLSINLPTGLGKTLTSLAFALKLRKKIATEKGYVPRIIYCLPFLSIIEQNAEQFEKVLRTNGLNVDTSLLLKHHHLSEVYYKKDEVEFEQDQAKILIEGWNSEIIVTTFVQLFYALLSNRNKDLRKFHRLAGSIIVLDEVQSIPSNYWLLVREIFKKLTEQLDCYIVFVTATEPLIFSREETIPLVERKTYFEKMARVVVRPHLEKDLTLEEFAESIEIDDNRSYLFILNTINSAKTFYNLLKEKIGSQDIIYLSTHVVPYERLERIKKMKEKRVKFAVTTQVVEAGVDIDFDVVYRDLAPLDSINQAAGRCNRNWSKKGEVIVVSLKDEKRLYSSYIYDSVLLDITRRILARNEFIEEKDFLKMIEEYYEEVQSKKSTDKSRELLNAVYKMKYDSVDGTTCIADFKLIDEDYPKLDTFIELNDEAKCIWKRYVDIKEIKNLIERRLEFSRIRADFYKYTVSIPVNTNNLPPEVAGFRYVSNNMLQDYYDENTGFKCEGVTALW